MAEIKTYTVANNKYHRLIKAAVKKELNNIVISWYPALNYTRRTGWYLECTEVPYLHLGYEVSEAEKRINAIELKPKTQAV